MKKEVTVPEGVSVSLEAGVLAVKGPKGELAREMKHPSVTAKVKGSTIEFESSGERRKANAIVGTWAAHARNMITGVTAGWEGRLKAVYSHFPMKLAVEGSKVVVNNFMGERMAREVEAHGDVKIDVKKDEIIVTGINRDDVGQTCGKIENKVKVTGRDRRVFQDGIYILGKPVPVEEGKKE
jgi:large subunit ribosomal protein L6